MPHWTFVILIILTGKIFVYREAHFPPQSDNRVFLLVDIMKAKKLVYGVGLNNADYAVRKMEEIGCIDGKRKRSWHGVVLTTKSGKVCLIGATLKNGKRNTRHIRAVVSLLNG